MATFDPRACGKTFILISYNHLLIEIQMNQKKRLNLLVLMLHLESFKFISELTLWLVCPRRA